MQKLNATIENLNIKGNDVTKKCRDDYAKNLDNNFSDMSKLSEETNYDNVMFNVLTKVLDTNENLESDKDIFMLDSNDEVKEVMDSEINHYGLHIFKINEDIAHQIDYKNVVLQINFRPDKSSYLTFFCFVENK